MLHFVRGKILDPWDHGLVIDCGAIALELYMAHHQSMQLMETNMDDPDRVLTIPVVMETKMQPNGIEVEMLGFATQGARDLYQALVRIPKIGRETALRTLESGTHLDMLRAVAAKDRKWLMHFEGIGQAKADTIIKELGKVYDRALPRPAPGGLVGWIAAREDLMASHDLTLDSAEHMLFTELSRPQ